MDDNLQIALNYSKGPQTRKSREAILASILRLQAMHKAGLLGGAIMPEDENPGLPSGTMENYHYFTLTMALNYQRNSYSLWKAAKKTFIDPECQKVFNPVAVVDFDEHTLRELLTRYRLALQPNSHVKIWRRISESIVRLLNGDVRQLFVQTGGSVPAILQFVQHEHGDNFPYLKGPKICNYWLYVMSQYTDSTLQQREALNVAPDTHVIQATVRLGAVQEDSLEKANNVAELVAQRWAEILAGTAIAPIDIHTPLWLWSRSGFIPIA
jgi:hypothetical protein